MVVAIHRGSAADTVDVMFCKLTRDARGANRGDIGKPYEARHISLQGKHAPVPLPATPSWSPEAIAEAIASYQGRLVEEEEKKRQIAEAQAKVKAARTAEAMAARPDRLLMGSHDLSKAFYTHAAPSDVRARLDRGADVNEADADGNTPLLFAVLFTRDVAVVELLLASGSNPHQSNRDRLQPL